MEPRNRPRRTHRVSGGIAQLFLNLGTRRGVWSASRPSRLYPRERPGTHCTGGWVGPGAGLDRCGKSLPTGIRSPHLPARSEPLYRLRHPGSRLDAVVTIIEKRLKSLIICGTTFTEVLASQGIKIILYKQVFCFFIRNFPSVTFSEQYQICEIFCYLRSGKLSKFFPI
jgi:hypothetical protein